MSVARRITLDPHHPNAAHIAEAAAALRAGALVVFPTETVYGLGANCLDPDAVARIFAAKGRPAWNPVIAHVASMEAAQALTRDWPEAATRLAHAFWPGPLTLVLLKAPHVPDVATAGLDAVAVRIPDHPVALALLRAAGVPVAAPSANRFTQVSPTTAEHAARALGDRVAYILDGGPCQVGIESTVLDLTGRVPTVLRPGMISVAAIEAVLGATVRPPTGGRAAAVAHDGGAAVAAQRGPGMADRHYAPSAEVWLFSADQHAQMVTALAARAADGGPVMALLLHTTLPTTASLPAARLRTMPDNPAAYARALYAALHDADEARIAVLVIEQPPERAEWTGVRDRLTRAAR